MDFLNLITQYDSLNQFTKQGMTTLNNFNGFFKTLHKYSDLLVINSKKSVEILFNDMIKYDSKSTLSKNFFEFYRNYESFLTKMKQTLTKLEKDIIEPINQFTKHLNGKSNEGLSELKSIVSSTVDSKKKLEVAKHKYFDTCKLAGEQEKLVIKVITEREKNRTSDDEVSHAHDILFKLRAQAENNCHSYKLELSKTNKTFEDNDKKYFDLMEKLKLNEESRVSFAKYHFEKFAKLLEDFSANTTEFIKRTNNSLVEVKVDEDLKIFEEKFNYMYRNNERIPREEFINYDLYRRNLERILSTDNDENVAESFFKKLRTTGEEMVIEDLTKIMDKLDQNLLFNKVFIDTLLKTYKSSLYVRIPNYQNFCHFANLLLTITNNAEIRKELFEINFAVIYIAEKTYYVNADNTHIKSYLCKLLSKSEMYSNKKFWKDLIEIKTRAMIENKLKNDNKPDAKATMNESNSTSANVSSNLGLFGKMKNLFVNKEIKIEETNSDESFTNEGVIVIKEYIPHFCNFGLEVSVSIDIIVELSSKYKYDKDRVTYFISLLNSNMFTIKNKTVESYNSKNGRELCDMKHFRKYLSLNDISLTTIANSIKYLTPKEYYNILQVNKPYNKKLGRIIYKNILLGYHQLCSKDKIKIWNSLLKLPELKKELNYKQLLEEIDSNPDMITITETISLDVQRTPFESDTEQNRSAIFNILRATAYKQPTINYCQGMNYIAAFVLKFTNDEEEAFFFLLGLISYTDYGNIFTNDLEKLKQMFYVFDRLLFIYMPELHFYLKSNGVSPSYYVAPWFITLFTNSFQYVTESENPKLIVRVIDEFLLNGWKTIIQTGITLIKHYENHLLTLKYEELLHFLINDMIKCEFFQTSNYDYFIKMTKVCKIPSGLISNLENEYLMDIKIKDNEEKIKQEQNKIIWEKENTIKI